MLLNVTRQTVWDKLLVDADELMKVRDEYSSDKNYTAHSSNRSRDEITVEINSEEAAW